MIAAMAMHMPSASASSTSQPVNVIKKPAAEVGLLNNECSTSVGTTNNGLTTVLPEIAMPDKVTTSNNTPATCNRCQKCPGFIAAQDWRRSMCANCKCPRSNHDMNLQICCSIHRTGFDLATFENPKQQVTASTTSAKGCRVKALSESEGYSWVPLVSVFTHLKNAFQRPTISSRNVHFDLSRRCTLC